MIERKINPNTHFSEGSSFHKDLSHSMHRAGLSDQGRERVLEAMKAATEHVVHKNDLRLGVGGKHLETMEHFLDHDYHGRNDLKPKERDFIRNSFATHYGIERNEAA